MYGFDCFDFLSLDFSLHNDGSGVVSMQSPLSRVRGLGSAKKWDASLVDAASYCSGFGATYHMVCYRLNRLDRRLLRDGDHLDAVTLQRHHDGTFDYCDLSPYAARASGRY